MTIISRRILAPIAGKSHLVIERAQRLAAVMIRAGAGARVSRVVMGEGAGNLEVYGRYSSFATGIKSFQEIVADSEFKALQGEAEKEPGAVMSGPYVYRTIFGELTAQTVLVQREYKVPRANMKSITALLPEIRSLFGASTGIAAAVPTFAPEMDRLVVVYYADSLDALGHVLDETAMSDAFQNITVRAAEYGTLMSSRVLRVL